MCKLTCIFMSRVLEFMCFWTCFKSQMMFSKMKILAFCNVPQVWFIIIFLFYTQTSILGETPDRHKIFVSLIYWNLKLSCLSRDAAMFARRSAHPVQIGPTRPQKRLVRSADLPFVIWRLLWWRSSDHASPLGGILATAAGRIQTRRTSPQHSTALCHPVCGPPTHLWWRKYWGEKKPKVFVETFHHRTSWKSAVFGAAGHSCLAWSQRDWEF